GRPVAEAALPKGEDLDFITGASMIASRGFYEAVGPMREDYFLYYEEADWALRRGEMPLVVAEGLVVYHHAGTSIGSPTLERLASPFSFWFKYHSRMLFVRRFNPIGLPVAMAYATVKAMQLLVKGAVPQAGALLRAVWWLGAPQSVRERLSPEAQRIAFGRADRQEPPPRCLADCGARSRQCRGGRPSADQPVHLARERRQLRGLLGSRHG